MNERIKQLAGQSLDKIVPYTWTKLDYDQIQKLQEHFAELIIAECAQACINMGNEYEIKSAGQYQAELFAFAIKKHFGVE
jgi:hypothetical protein